MYLGTIPSYTCSGEGQLHLALEGGINHIETPEMRFYDFLAL